MFIYLCTFAHLLGTVNIKRENEKYDVTFYSHASDVQMSVRRRKRIKLEFLPTPTASNLLTPKTRMKIKYERQTQTILQSKL